MSQYMYDLPKLLVQGVHVHQSNSRTTSRPIYSEEVSHENYLFDDRYKSSNVLNRANETSVAQLEKKI